MLGEGKQLAGHLIGRQHEIGQARGDGRSGHAIKLGAFLILHHHHATISLDDAHPPRTVAARSRENDGDGFFGLILGQRP